VIRVGIAFMAVAAATWPLLLAAQSSTPQATPVAVGDHWMFDTRDEITNSPLDTLIQLVTDVSPTEIVVRLSSRGKPGFQLVVFDHDWDRIEDPRTKWKPNDGQGTRMPLTVGKEWRTELESRSIQNGGGWTGTVLSKVTAREMVMTPAGMFDTFRIEERIRDVNTADPSRYQDQEAVIWYAPQINHFVRRTNTTLSQKRVSAKVSAELVDFGRKL
jgi:hypothetical protein